MNDTSKWNQSGTRCDYRIHSNSIREQSGRRNTFLPGSGSYQLFVSWLSAASSADTPYRWLHCRTWMKTPRPSGDLNVSSNTSSTKPHHKIIFQISSFLFVFPFVSFSSILFVFVLFLFFFFLTCFLEIIWPNIANPVRLYSSNSNNWQILIIMCSSFRWD